MKIKLLTISLLTLLTTAIFGQSQQLYLKWDENPETNIFGYYLNKVTFSGTNLIFTSIGTNLGKTNVTWAIPAIHSTNGAVFAAFAFNSDSLLSMPSNLVTNKLAGVSPSIPKNPKAIKF